MTLAERLRAALASAPVEPPLAGDLPELRAAADIPAAVLIAITDREEPGVILTVRREHMRTHAGQIAFPGGRIDPGEDAVEAALREAHEEILLDPSAKDDWKAMRFALIPGDDQEFIPLPEVPITVSYP